MSALLRWVDDALATIPPGVPVGAATCLMVWRYRPRVGRRPLDETPRSAKTIDSHQQVSVDDPTPVSHTRHQVPGEVDTPPGERSLTAMVASPEAPSRQPTWRPPTPEGLRVGGPAGAGPVVLPDADGARPRPRRRSRPRPPVGADEAARWCDAIARELRAGGTIMAAIIRAERPRNVDRCVGPVLFSVERGRPLTVGLESLAAEPLQNPHLALVVTVLRTVARHGGPAAQPIDRAAATLRARATDEAERAAQSAQARMSAVVMTVLPIAMLCMLVATSPSVRGVLSTPLGAGVVAVGMGFNGLGWLWMRRIVNGGVA